MLLNLLVKPIWIITEIYLHDALGHEVWGTYTALYSFVFIFSVLADFGINPYATQKLAAQPSLFQSHFPNVLSLKLILGGVFPFVMLGTGYVWGFRGGELYLLALLSLVVAANQLQDLTRSVFRAQQEFRRDAWASVLERALLLLIVWGLLWMGAVNLERFVFSRLGAISLAILILGLGVKHLLGNIRLSWDKTIVRQVFTASLIFATTTILASIHDKVDQVMLQKLVGEEETSLYAAAYRWLDASSMFLWIVLAVFFARFARFRENKEEKYRLLYFGQVITAIPLIFLGVFAFFYGEYLIRPLFPHSTEVQLVRMTWALKVLFGALLIQGLTAVYGTLLTATGHVKEANICVLISIGVNVGLNLYLIPRYGAWGAAYATCVSFGLIGLGLALLVQFRTEVDLPLGLLGKLIVLTGLLIGIFYAVQQLPTPWYVNSLLAGGIYLGVGYGLGIIPKELWEVLKK